jgi:hypothetical protein
MNDEQEWGETILGVLLHDPKETNEKKNIMVSWIMLRPNPLKYAGSAFHFHFSAVVEREMERGEDGN